MTHHFGPAGLSTNALGQTCAEALPRVKYGEATLCTELDTLPPEDQFEDRLTLNIEDTGTLTMIFAQMNVQGRFKTKVYLSG